MIMASKAPPNGTATTRELAPSEASSLPPVIGINFGNSYASIAVLNKDALAECIANEDGERQIACAIAFHGEEMYIGNQAKHQLIKNSSNTILGFRDLLGKRLSEIDIERQKPLCSAPVIEHPEIADEPAYRVEVLQPAPTPLSSTTTTATVSAAQTPAASYAPTPRSEPIPTSRIVTVTEAATIFLQYLVEIASDFLGKPIVGAVLAVPPYFTQNQREGLLKAAEGAGVGVLQLVEEAGAVASATTAEAWTSGGDLAADRVQLAVDLGASSLSLALIAHRGGLAHVLCSSVHFDVCGREIDDRLIRYFAKDFAKKNKAPLRVCPATQVSEKRAEAKLRLAVEHTKRTLAASAGAATCSVESLWEGMDYTGSINRMRFDLEMRGVYAAVAEKVRELLGQAQVDGEYVDEIVYCGGTACLPGLNEVVCLEGGFGEGVVTPFGAGTVAGGGIGDPTEVLARGCALQAEVVYSLKDEGDGRVLGAFGYGSEMAEARTTGRTVGLFPGGAGEHEEKWICLLAKETPLPARRAAVFDLGLGDESGLFAFEVWEVTTGVKVEKIRPPPGLSTASDSSDEEGTAEKQEEEEEEEEVKRKIVTKDRYLGGVKLEAKAAVKIKGKWKTSVDVRLVCGRGGDIRLTVKELGMAGGEEVIIPGFE